MVDDTQPPIPSVLDEVTKRVSIRLTHPNLFRSLVVVALMSVALAANFYFSKPTFNPYGIPKAVIGSIFLALGATQLILLSPYVHSRKLVRLVTAASFSFMLFWGVSNTEQSFAGRASFQLPILYLGLAALQFPLLLEPSVNPLTANGNDKKLNGTL